MSIKKINDTLVLSLTISYFLRLALPQMKYIFYPLLLVSVIAVCIFNYKELHSKLIYFVRDFALILLIFVVYSISFLYSEISNIILYKEFLNFFIVVLFLFILHVSVTNIEDFNILLSRVSKYLIGFSVIISALGLIKLYLQLTGVFFPFYNSGAYPEGTALTEDYNFYSLFSLLSIILLTPRLLLFNSRSKSIIIQVSLLVLSLNIILSTSRRGMLALLMLVIALVAIYLMSEFYDKPKLKLIIHNLKLFLVLFILIISTFFGIIKYTEPVQLIKYISLCGLKDYYFIDYSTKLAYKIKSVFHKQVSYYETYNSLWRKNFDPLYPQSGWGTGIYTPIFKLEGKGSEDIPRNSVGYKLDSTSLCSAWGGNGYSYTQLAEIKITPKTKYVASAYCFVSSDFNGDLANINSKGNSTGETSSFYDMKKKGQWQKLAIFFYGNDGFAPIYLFISKTGVSDFSSLRGYVIFAFPQYKEDLFDPLNPTSWAESKMYKEEYPLSGVNVNIVPKEAKGCLLDKNSDYSTWNGNTYSFLCIGDSIIKSDEIIHTSVYCYVSQDFNGEWVRLSSEFTKTCQKQYYYNLSKKGEWQTLKLDIKCNEGSVPIYLYFAKYGVTDFSNLKGYVIFAYPTYEKKQRSIDTTRSIEANNKRLQVINIAEKAPISFASILNFRLNTFTSHKEKNYADQDYISKKDSVSFSLKYDDFELAGPRLDRWRFGWYIFKAEYTWKQKIIGGGFTYMLKYGNKFNNNPNQLDWPHNPLISVLLYSGIIGLLLYVFFLYKVFHIYWKYRKEYWPIFVCFIVTLFFSFFSANNPLDPPIMGFFVLLPFFIHSIHKNENQPVYKKLSNDKDFNHREK